MTIRQSVRGVRHPRRDDSAASAEVPTQMGTTGNGNTHSPRNILLVSDSYAPLIGGATQAMQRLAEQLCSRGHKVTVITAWQRGAPAMEDDREITIHRVRDLLSRVRWLSSNPHRHTPPPFPDLEATWRIRSIITQVQPDVVYAYGWLSYSCAAALLGKRTPLIISARDYGNICALRTLMRQGRICDGPAPRKCLACASSFYGAPKGTLAVAGVLSGRALLRRKIRGLHSCSHYMQAIMRRYLLRKHSLPLAHGDHLAPDYVIPDFRDDSRDGVVDQTLLDRLPTTPYILFVGALRVVKGIMPLLAAYERLPAPPPLVLIGTRHSDTPTAFPSGVTVLYDVPHGTVMAAWERSLFGVAPSILPEPLGNVVHEAMSKGKAMIGSTAGGMTDMIVEGETGLLILPGDVDMLAAAMRRLIDDGPLRERMGRAGRERALQFTAEAVMPRFEALFDAALVSER